eukprot:746229-Hanusia_phi.AAC.8
MSAHRSLEDCEKKARRAAKVQGDRRWLRARTMRQIDRCGGGDSHSSLSCSGMCKLHDERWDPEQVDEVHAVSRSHGV